MSRLIASATQSDALLGNNAFGRYANQLMLDLSNGGQMGWAPNLTEWVSNQAYVRTNLICILLEAPRFFQAMPEPSKWVQVLKSLVELHPKTIEGLKGGIQATFEQHAVGGAGEMQDELTNTTRDRSEPVFSFTELYGMPIQTFLTNWMMYGMMDPDTKHALIATLPANGQVRPTDLLADWSSMSCLFIEPDPTHKRVVKSWVCANMMPKSTGDIIGKKDKTGAGEMTELSIEFTSITQFNLGTNAFAQGILNSINVTNANPNLRASFIQDISADVASAAQGYKTELQSLAVGAIVK